MIKRHTRTSGSGSARPVSVVRYGVMTWGLAYATFQVVRLIATSSQETSGLNTVDWAQVIAGLVLGLAATGVAAALGSHPGGGSCLWLLSGGAVLSSWGLLQELLMITSAQLPEDLWGLGGHILAVIGAVLLVSLSARQSPTPLPQWMTAGPSARAARVAAVSGTVAFVPYAGMKTLWAVGGSFAGRTGREAARISADNGASETWRLLQSWGLDPTVLFACTGVFLLWALVLSWGRAIPRWLLLVPSVIAVATLLPYGLIGVGYTALVTAGVLTIAAGDFPTPGDALLVAWIGLTAFAGFGAALTVASWSFWARTRPTDQNRTPRDHVEEALQ